MHIELLHTNSILKQRKAEISAFGFSDYMDDIDDYENELNQEISNRDENTSIGHQMYKMLRGTQLEFVNKILIAFTDQRLREDIAFSIFD